MITEHHLKYSLAKENFYARQHICYRPSVCYTGVS